MRVLRIQDIPPAGVVLSYDENAAEFQQDGLMLEGGVHVRLDARRHQAKEVLLQVSVCARVISECSRCLTPFPEGVQVDFSVHCVPLLSSPSEEHHALSEAEIDVHSYSGEAIRVHELVASQIHLSVAPYPRCREDCCGLCPHCGEDLNRGVCGCPTEGEETPTVISIKEKYAQSKT